MRETEQRNGTRTLEALSPLEFLKVMNEEDGRVAAAVGAALEEISHVIETAAWTLSHGGRLIYVGAGTSGRLGVLDAAECSPTFGLPEGLVVGVIAGGNESLRAAGEGTEDDLAAGRQEMERLGVGLGDLVVGIASSGRTPFTIEAVRTARERGARTAGVVNVAGSEITGVAECVVEVLTGAEILAGSTRLKAGTAQKMVLNMISTGTMVALGYTYENLMVGVVPSNSKLRERAHRIVREITGCTEETAAELLECADYDVRVAVLLFDGVGSAGEARNQLWSAGSSLQRARAES